MSDIAQVTVTLPTGVQTITLDSDPSGVSTVQVGLSSGSVSLIDSALDGTAAAQAAAETAQGLAEAAQVAAEAAAASVDLPLITGNALKYLRANAGGTALEYAAAGGGSADEVTYSNAGSGLTSTTVQGAIDEVVAGLGTASAVDTGTASGNVPLLTTGGAMALAGQLDLSGASSGQIKFPATQNASANANTLDDYEEGTWTPVIIGTTTAGTGTYTTRSGEYVKIGKVVYCSLFVTTTAHTGTGNMRISGLPFTAGRSMGAIARYTDALTITGILETAAIVGETYIAMFSGNNGASAALALDTACSIAIDFFYFV